MSSITVTMFRPDTDELYQQAQAAQGSAQLMIKPELHVGRLQRAAQLVAMVKPKSVLDIGCGKGDLLPLLNPKMEYLGIEPNVQLCPKNDLNRPLVRFLNQKLEDLPVIPQTLLSDMVIALGLTCHLLSGQKPLDWFANTLQKHAGRWMIVEFQKWEKYHGAFTSHGDGQIEAAFGQRIRPEYRLGALNDSTETILFTLR